MTETAMTLDLHGATLPVGWIAEIYGRPDDGVIAITRHEPNAKWSGGSVSISFKYRIFSGGYGYPYRHVGSQTYAGRGWKKQIVEDACAWLKGEMKS